MQQEDFGLELIPLMKNIPQLLQGEPGPVGVLRVQASHLLLAQRLLVGKEHITPRKKEHRKGRKEGRK